ncbi:cytidylate kinase-like family protein [Magnetococcus sp. PR-3]|uniref:cytidylate kinase-like family protein n=1 Tax=Magnetococcus sp. PR-3 TaxID=3120355 RepID=UPI002FCE37DE
MSKPSLDLVKSIVGAGLFSEEHEQSSSERASPPLVAVSRTLGANGTVIAQKLAEKLGVPYYDQDLIDRVLKEADQDKVLMQRIDERATNFMDDFIYAIFSDKQNPKDAYFQALVKVLINISRNGGVVVGRGSHMLLPEERTFRLRFECGRSKAIQRIASRESISEAEAEKRIESTNAQRTKFIAKMPNRFPALESEFDLILHTDHFQQDNATVDAIIGMMNAGGYSTRMPN